MISLVWTSSSVAGVFDCPDNPFRIPPFPQIFYPPFPPCFRFMVLTLKRSNLIRAQGRFALIRGQGSRAGFELF